MEMSIPPQSDLSTDLNILTAEINTYQKIAGEAIFEIGKRLKYVKENDLVYGEWEQWCKDELRLTPQHANRFIRVFDRFSNRTPVFETLLTLSVLDALIGYSDEELEIPRDMPDGSTKKLTEMSRREIEEFKRREQEAIREKEKAVRAAEVAENRAKRAEEQADALRDTLESIRDEPPKRDEETTKRLQMYERRFGDISIYEGDGVHRILSETEVSGTVLAFSNDARELVKKYAFLKHYESEFATLNSESYTEYQRTFETLKSFIADVERSMSARKNINVILDM